MGFSVLSGPRAARASDRRFSPDWTPVGVCSWGGGRSLAAPPPPLVTPDGPQAGGGGTQTLTPQDRGAHAPQTPPPLPARACGCLAKPGEGGAQSLWGRRAVRPTSESRERPHVLKPPPPQSCSCQARTPEHLVPPPPR